MYFALIAVKTTFIWHLHKTKYGIKKDELRELVYKADVITLLQDGLEKVANGLTTFEELLKLIELEDDDNNNIESGLEQAKDYTNIANNTENKEEIDA